MIVLNVATITTPDGIAIIISYKLTCYKVDPFTCEIIINIAITICEGTAMNIIIITGKHFLCSFDSFPTDTTKVSPIHANMNGISDGIRDESG